ncbi:hypothetical protein CVT25_006663 [Psilocybe cyanescens]|uniref:Uncharacterized protein n=1 Tax=Psilocybe cyanescens TaxID=93625 RepID=A0A409XU63_PSICY|nr:hypothetical protein CVT25_006663 [Psilocybe cyanescens]
MASFLRNFPANCFDDAHINNLIETIGLIQVELFPRSMDTGVGAIGFLKKTIEDRFSIKDSPDGYSYFPITRGGLDLRNVVLKILALERHETPLASLGKVGAGTDVHTNTERVDVSGSGYSLNSLAKIGSTPDEEFVKQVENDRRAYECTKAEWDSLHPTSTVRCLRPCKR